MPKILIIDDSPTDVHIYTKMLTSKGFEVESAEDAESGIEKASSWQPDLILMDVIMPGMNGFQATRKLSKMDDTSHIPVIVVTTKNMETDRVWSLRQGARDFVTKPVKDGLLIEKINANINQG